MNTSTCTARYRRPHEELSRLVETVLAGEVVRDRPTAERLVRFLGAVTSLHERHVIDQSGRCTMCWSPPRWLQPWPRRRVCARSTQRSTSTSRSRLVLWGSQARDP